LSQISAELVFMKSSVFWRCRHL